MGNFILGNFNRKPLTGEPGPGNKLPKPQKWLGNAVVAGPLEAHTKLNYTGPPGSVSGMYYSLVFQLGKWEFNTTKLDEWIEVSPTHAQYYQLTHRQKEELENRIKSGLQSVSQAVADLEMLQHDKRKYEEFLRYMGYRTVKETKQDHKGHNHRPEDEDYLCFLVDNDGKTRKEREKRTDNHSLKAVFIDQVDFHTGDGISMRSIVSRWPTLIIDFMKISDEDMNIDKVSKELDVSRAEAVVLITKNKLYQEWKRMFLGNLKERYGRIMTLYFARLKSVEQYREWLKPTIARHKLIEEGLSQPHRGAGPSNPYVVSGHMLSSQTIEIMTWKDFQSPEFFKSGSEDIARATSGKRENWKISPYDAWTKKNLIFDKKNGLIADHPWITDDWVKEQLNYFYDRNMLTRHKWYYSVFIVGVEKNNVRTPTGEEMEDGVFDINMLVMSQNVLFAKLLEVKAKEREFETYVESMLGMPHPKPLEGKPVVIDEKNRLKTIENFFEWFSIGFQFFKRGPYERDFDERLTKYYFAPIAGSRYAAIIGFLKGKMGIGQ